MNIATKTNWCALLSVSALLLMTVSMLGGGSPVAQDNADKKDPVGPVLGGSVLPLARTGGNVVAEFSRMNDIAPQPRDPAVEGMPNDWFWRNGEIAVRYSESTQGLSVELFDKKKSLLGCGRLKDNLAEGHWLWKEDNIMLTCNYNLGKLDGALVSYRDGELAEWSQYEGGKLDGLDMSFASSTEGDYVTSNWKNDQLQGVTIEYHNGIPEKVYHYQAGKLHGSYIEYGKDGEVLVRGTYKDGEQVGKWDGQKD
ncbi:MAG: hypothetical protein R3E76_10195 [Planctomycetota bacterium]